jgi:hypothetical protein
MREAVMEWPDGFGNRLLFAGASEDNLYLLVLTPATGDHHHAQTH